MMKAALFQILIDRLFYLLFLFKMSL